MTRCWRLAALALCLLPWVGARGGEAQRQAAAQALDSLRQSERYEEARQAAELLIEYTTAELGEDSPALVQPLIDQGEVYDALKRPDSAIESYARASALIEQHEGVFSPRLVELLRSISRSYQALRRMEEAESALQRAKVITHRNLGITNLAQIPIVEELSELYVDTRDYRNAHREQMFAFHVKERRFGVDSPQLVPGILSLAAWYRRTGQPSTARELYRRAVSILETANGPDDLGLVEPLYGIAQTYVAERIFRREGREALERAEQLYGRAQYADEADHAQALIKLGDWSVLTGDGAAAQAAYQRAWQLLSQGEGGSPDRAELMLGAPAKLSYREPIPELYPQPADSGEDTFVVVEFIVNEDGSVRDPVVVSSNASNKVERQVRMAVLSASYRPGFAEGKPVPSKVRLTQRFYAVAPPSAATAPAAQSEPGTP